LLLRLIVYSVELRSPHLSILPFQQTSSRIPNSNKA
jgi:hypothetical protein